MRAPESGSLYIYDSNLTRAANGSYASSLVSSTLKYSQRVASYTNNKGWRQRIKKGTYPVAPYDVTWNNISSVAVGEARTYSSAGVLLQASKRNYAPTFGLQPFDNGVVNEALGKYREKLANASGSFKALVPLAEAKELRGLVNTMAESVPSVLHGITDIRRGRPRDAFKRASNLWLAWSFGFSPLMSDAAAIANAIAARVEAKPFVRIHARAERTKNIELSNPFSEGIGAYTSAVLSGVIRQTCSCSFTGTYSTSIGSGVNYKSAAEQFGISIPELVPAAWELIPYSFIIDYFTNAGDVINDTFSVGPQASTLVRSQKNLCTVHKTRRIVPISGFTVDASITDENFESGSFSRSLLATLPSRTFQFESFGSIGKIKRVINLAAILAK